MLRRSSFFVLGSLLLLVGCGSEGGTVAVDLTDEPPDTSLLDHVVVTLAAVEVHVVDDDAKGDGDPKDKSIDGDDKWRTITSRAGAIDLVALRDDVRATLGELALPGGKITQIRLHVDPNGKNEVSLKTGEMCALDVSGLDATGIKISHPFKAIDVPEGGTVRVVVDFDLEESLDQESPKGCAFALKPVIKIKSVTDE